MGICLCGTKGGRRPSMNCNCGTSAVFCTVRTKRASRCTIPGRKTTLSKKLHLWELHRVFALSGPGGPVVAQHRAGEQPCPSTAPVNNRTCLRSITGMSTTLSKKWKEAPFTVDRRLLELVVHVHGDVHNHQTTSESGTLAHIAVAAHRKRIGRKRTWASSSSSSSSSSSCVL